MMMNSSAIKELDILLKAVVIVAAGTLYYFS